MHPLAHAPLFTDPATTTVPRNPPVPLLCTIGDAGQPSNCGYGCAAASFSAIRSNVVNAAGLNATAASAMAAATGSFCEEGCVATNPAMDPFSEFAPGALGGQSRGFRGFAAGVDAVCGRTCGWYTALPEATKAFYLAESTNPYSSYRNILTQDDVKWVQPHLPAHVVRALVRVPVC